ncbi:MAG: glucose-1-phosphate cytidylyltransferase [Planctomycetaceae bacterium]|jgi:glucose-1-phosphate cytidylyltransferase|nr:glucose-1-phosphate cytidylyltransferase [Planctomycetaceae bacterium]
MTKVALLAGGLGTRLSEETDLKPKPMVTVGDRPILWHIMKYFSCFGLEDFFVATGYKGEVIKTYFSNYRMIDGSIAVDLSTGHISDYTVPTEHWKVHLIATGPNTMTGGRIFRMKNWLADSGPFIVTYGDGVANVNINALLKFHKSHGKLATMTAVRPPSRFGEIEFDGDQVISFSEKPQTGEGWINGGFIVFETGIFDYLSNDSDSLEKNALENVARDGQLMAFRHDGFWQCMDTLRDKIYLDELWKSGEAPWKIWDDAAILRIRRAA